MMFFTGTNDVQGFEHWSGDSKQTCWSSVDSLGLTQWFRCQDIISFPGRGVYPVFRHTGSGILQGSWCDASFTGHSRHQYSNSWALTNKEPERQDCALEAALHQASRELDAYSLSEPFAGARGSVQPPSLEDLGDETSWNIIMKPSQWNRSSWNTNISTNLGAVRFFTRPKFIRFVLDTLLYF